MLHSPIFINVQVLFVGPSKGVPSRTISLMKLTQNFWSWTNFVLFLTRENLHGKRNGNQILVKQVILVICYKSKRRPGQLCVKYLKGSRGPKQKFKSFFDESGLVNYKSLQRHFIVPNVELTV